MNSCVDDARLIEHAKYERCYQAANYAMGRERRESSVKALKGLPFRGAYLDVGCGRGEMLAEAEALGFDPVRGVEVVSGLIDGQRVVYGECHALPFEDGSFDTATLFDVMEHLLPGDDELACRELARVARRHIVLTVSNCISRNANGDELHINRRPYEEWDALFRVWFPGSVTWIRGKHHYISEAWRIDL